MTTLIIFSANYLHILIIVLAILSLIFTNPETRKAIIKLSLLTFSTAFIVAKILGHFIYNPRPFVVEHVQPLIAHAVNNGFPSDHTLLTMTIATILFIYNKKLGMILGILALLVGIARVLAKVHHPVDILASIAIAWLVTFLSRSFLSKAIKSKRVVFNTNISPR